MERPARIALGTLAALALIAAAAPIAAYVEPGLAGADRGLIVLTGSMEPTISPGDVVLVEAVDIEQVETGDVVTFHPHAGVERTVTHRVVDVTHDDRGTILTTKGDANEDPDPMQVNDEMLIGRVDHTIPMLGTLIAAAQGPLVPLGLVVLSILTIGHELSNVLARVHEPDEEGPTSDAETHFAVVESR